MRYDPDHKARTRERVLDEAAAAIRVGGSDGVGVAATMRRAGLTHGGFYAHFASRDDLLADVVEHMFAEAQARFFADADARDPRDVLAHYVDRYLSIAHLDTRERGCPVPILAGEAHRMPDRARERFAAAIARMVARIATLLERARVDDARSRAGSALAEMVGAVGLARLMLDPLQAESLLATARRSVRAKLDLPGEDGRTNAAG